MKIVKSIRSSHTGNRYVALRLVLAVASLVSMVLASGAGSQWQ